VNTFWLRETLAALVILAALGAGIVIALRGC